mgnify:CR=1 FL=1
MKSKILNYIVPVLVMAVLLLGAAYVRLKKDNASLLENQKALIEEAKYYNVNDEYYAASTRQITLEADEVKSYLSDVSKRLDQLDIKLSRVKNISQTGSEMNVEMRAVVKDSVITERGNTIVKDTVKAFRWSDSWADVSGYITKDTASIWLQSRDTLTTVVHRIPKKFLFFRWGTKAIEQLVYSRNPHNRITYDRYVKLE